MREQLKMKKRIQLAALSVLVSFSQPILVYGEQAQPIARPTNDATTAKPSNELLQGELKAIRE
jgi:hypothetical protein